jgi:amino acid adenylation domain-containing protein
MHNQMALDKPFEPVNGESLPKQEQQRAVAPPARNDAYGLHRVPDLVSTQCAASPEATAVVAGAEKITYRELDLRATQLAHHLRMLGVGPDVVVALCLHRSVSFVIGALAIWKAGGAYLPIDLSYPNERINFILKDAEVPIVLTREALATAFARGPWKLVDVDREWSFTPALSGTPGPLESKPESLAYVIYTSGSTGRPKGVEITHRGLANLVGWHVKSFGITPSDRATQLSSLGFDAAVWELWPYLASGSSVHMPDEETRLQPEMLQEWIAREKITISFVSTPLAERLIALDWPAKSSLRFLLTGADTLQQYPRPGLPFELINNYGPTECSVVATSGRVSVNGHSSLLPAIGRPIQNVKIVLLDKNLREVAVGSAGEIHIGGVSLARGYRNSSELTKERFISDPSSDDPEARLFKTGDMAYFLPDGQLEFLGRIDDQIKIRGYRIEPNEIVAHLSRHEAVEASTVVANKLVSGEKRLVAYLVAKPGAKPCASDLRRHLRAHLPDYMVPETFVVLLSLPLNANGKLDRMALPLPDALNTLRDAGTAELRTPIGKRLAEIVEGLLEVKQIGADDNFFLLGGHSLLGTQLIARIQDIFGVAVSLRALFDSPTIAELSSHIERLIVARLEAMGEDEAQRLLGGGTRPAQEAV